MRLKNFKAYRDSKLVPLKPLTFVVGANNSGKSSLLHAILLLAQTLEDRTSLQALVTSGAYVDLGGYFDIIWGAQKTDAKSFSIELSLDERGAERRYRVRQGDSDALPTELRVGFTFDSARNAIVVTSSRVEGRGEVFVAAHRSGKGYTAPHIGKAARERLNVTFRHFLPALLPDRVSNWQRDDDALNYLFRSDEAWFTWTEELGRLAHVAPLREPVPRFGILGKSLTSELGPGGENLLRVLRASDAESGTGERLAAEVGGWISEKFGMLEALELVDVDPAGTILALLGDEREGIEKINLANMGEGLSQLLPIVARVLTTPEYGTLLIEQPEIHLHPAAQADLADLFISEGKHGNKQYIVETHSEHLLLRLRRRIAEGVVDPDKVAVLYVERDGSKSSVRVLDLDADGHFDDWPKGFFDERYREALAIAEASQARHDKAPA